MEMTQEYIIVNKTAIQKRIEELEKAEQQQVGNLNGYIALGEIRGLKQILSQSTPLLPEIEKAFWEGHQYESQNLNRQQKNYMSKLAEHYISNLKLDV